MPQERYSFDKVTAGTISADKIVSGNFIPGKAIESIDVTEIHNRIMRREWWTQKSSE